MTGDINARANALRDALRADPAAGFIAVREAQIAGEWTARPATVAVEHCETRASAFGVDVAGIVRLRDGTVRWWVLHHWHTYGIVPDSWPEAATLEEARAAADAALTHAGLVLAGGGQ